MAENAKDKLIVAVRDLILERGYGGTSVDAVCERAQVSKGSFFHHFRSKEDAACTTLDQWMKTMQELAHQSGFAEKATPQEQLLTYLDFSAGVMEAPDAPGGCLLGALALEVGETHSEVQTKASTYFESWTQKIAAMLGAALPRLDETEAQSLANHFIASLEGALLLAKAKQDRSIVRQCILHFRRYVESLM